MFVEIKFPMSIFNNVISNMFVILLTRFLLTCDNDRTFVFQNVIYKLFEKCHTFFANNFLYIIVTVVCRLITVLTLYHNNCCILGKQINPIATFSNIFI